MGIQEKRTNAEEVLDHDKMKVLGADRRWRK